MGCRCYGTLPIFFLRGQLTRRALFASRAACDHPLHYAITHTASTLHTAHNSFFMSSTRLHIAHGTPSPHTTRTPQATDAFAATSLDSLQAPPASRRATPLETGSVLKKRLRKMNRHKYKKWRKKMKSVLKKK